LLDDSARSVTLSAQTELGQALLLALGVSQA